MRWRRNGSVDALKRDPNRTEDERFWSYVRKTDHCWEWTAGLTHGYGNFYLAGKSVMAHRFAWERANGPLPDGVTLDHFCHTVVAADCQDGPACPHRRCVRPDHMEPMALPENIRLGGNAAKVRCKRGHPFSEENTHVGPRGQRYCRTCQRASAAAYRERQRNR